MRKVFLEELIYIFRQQVCREFALIPFMGHGLYSECLTKCCSSQPGFYSALEGRVSKLESRICELIAYFIEYTAL